MGHFQTAVPAGYLLPLCVLLFAPLARAEPNNCPYCYCSFGGRGAYDDDLTRLHLVKGDKFNDTTCSDWCQRRYPYVIVDEHYSHCRWDRKAQKCRSSCPGCEPSAYDGCKGLSEANCEHGQAGSKACNCSFSGGEEACGTCSQCACQYTMGYPEYVYATPDGKTEATPELCEKACRRTGNGRASGQWAGCGINHGKCGPQPCSGKGCTFVSSDCDHSTNPIICSQAGSKRVTCNCPLQSSRVAGNCPKNTDPPVYPNGPELMAAGEAEGGLYP